MDVRDGRARRATRGWTTGAALLLLSACCAAQEAPASARTVPPERRPCVAAYGLSSATEAPAFRRAGFDTAFVELPPRFAQTEGDARRLEAFLTACDTEDVSLILGVQCDDPRTAPGGLLSPYDTTAVNRLGAEIHHLVSLAGDHPCVIGWMTPRRLSESVALRDQDFAAYLQGRYGVVATLNERWDVRYSSFDEATAGQARAQAAISPLGLGAPLLDVAVFQTLLHRDALALFLRTYQRYDPYQRPVVAGEECNYWALANLPLGMFGAVTGLRPDEAGPDPLLGNPIAVDVARAGGLHAAFHGLEVRADTDPALLRRQAAAAFAHGAWGVVLSDWQTVAAEEALAELLPEIRSWTESTGPLPVRSSIALLYEPLHGGARSGTGYLLAGLLDARGWPSEPLAILAAFARGSRYGGIDVLPAHEVDAAALSRYAVVLAPQLYDVERGLADALWDYVKGGGLLYTDLGLGFHQSGTMTEFPATLMGLTGILAVPFILPMQLGGTVEQPCPALPSLVPGARTSGAVFGPVIGDARLTMGATPIVVFRSRRVAQRGNALFFASLSAHYVGRGAVLFATTPALAGLTPQDALGAPLWADLMTRGAMVENVGGDDFAPPHLEVRTGDGIVVAAAYDAGTEWATAQRAGSDRAVFRGALTETAAEGHDDVLLHIPVGESVLAIADRLPVRIPSPTTCVWVSEYGPDGLRATVAPSDASWSPIEGGYVAAGGTVQPLALEIAAGAFPILPREELEVVVRGSNGRPSETVRLTAGDDGVLRLDLGAAGPLEVTVRPRAPEALPGAERGDGAR